MISVSADWIQANAKYLVPITTMNCYIYDRRQGHTTEKEYSWTKDTIKSLKFNIHGDILSGTLPEYEAIIECDNILGTNGEYIITDENRLRLNGAEFYINYGYKGVSSEILYSLFVHDVEINKDTNTVAFILKTPLSFMTDVFVGQKTGTAYEVAESVFSQEYTNEYVPKPAGGFDIYQLDKSLNDVHISITDTDLTTAEVLQVIANACKCVIIVNFTGTIIIKPRNTAMQQYSLPRFVQYTKPIATVDPPVRGCKLTCSGEVSGAGYPSGLNKGEWINLENINLNAQTSSEALSVAKWVSDELAPNPKTYEFGVRYDPRLELFDTIQIQVCDEIRKAVVTDMKISYNGAWRAELKMRDNGSGTYPADDTIDVYNTMMEYLASVENGTGNYQEYTASYQDFLSYLEGGED